MKKGSAMLIEQEATEGQSFPLERRRAPRRSLDAQVARWSKELAAARHISQALSQHIQLDELIDRALSTALAVVNAESGSLLLADPKTERLVFRNVIGPQAGLLKEKAFSWNEGLAGAVFHSGKPEVITDVKKDLRHFPGIDEITGVHTRDMIVLPLRKWEGDSIGVLSVLNKREGRLDEDDLSILTIISAMTAVAIEQAQLFEEAKLAQVARLAGDISHDIKNLVMPVLCGAEILREEVHELLGSVPNPTGAKARESRKLCDEVIDMLRDDARRISDRMKEIADCVKGLSAPPQFAACHLADVVGSIFKTLEFLAKEKGVTLRSQDLDDLPKLEADERRLFNAFYNLVNNAISEVPEGGTITVAGKSDPSSHGILVTVSDTGRGMPPEIRDSLFTIGTKSRKAGGTGLGTKIVKDVVDAHGGTIRVESAVGAGTTFFLFLPLRPGGIAESRVRAVQN
jgi:signal transduction histidine kinase